MNPGVTIRTQDASGVNARRSGSLWLLAVFIAFGFLIAVTISLLAGSQPSGALLVSGGLLLLIPAIWLVVRAFPQGLAKLRLLRQNWTWWHPLWFLIFVSMLVFRIRDVDAAKANPLDAWAMTRVLPEAFVSLTLIVRLLLRRPSWLKALFTGIPGLMAVYCLICLASSAWSVNASWTAYKSLEFLADVSLLAAIVASADTFLSYQNLLDWTFTFYGLSLVGVWINLPIWPTEAMDGGRLTGVIPVEASNSVGTSGAVLSIVALCRLWPIYGKARSKAWYILLLIFGMASMVLSQTRNAEAAFVVAVLMLVFFSRQLRKVWLIGTAIVAPFLAVSLLVSQRMWLQAWDLLLSFAERDQSSLDNLSGRTAWWEYGMEQLSKHPFTGLGAYAAGRFAVLGKLGVGAAAMMHSDWVEVIIGTSFWGLIPFAAALIAAWWFLFRGVRSHAFAPEQRQLALECFALLSMLTIHSFFNDELSWHCPLLYFAILGYAEFIRMQGKRDAVPAAVPEPRTWQLDAEYS